MRLKNKVAIRNAADGSGIGKATANKMLKQDAKVAVTDIHERRIA